MNKKNTCFEENSKIEKKITVIFQTWRSPCRKWDKHGFKGSWTFHPHDSPLKIPIFVQHCINKTNRKNR